MKKIDPRFANRAGLVVLLWLAGRIDGMAADVSDPTALSKPPLREAQTTTVNFFSRFPTVDDPYPGLHMAPEPPNGRQIVTAALQRMQRQGFTPANVPQAEVLPPLPSYTIQNFGSFVTQGDLDAEAKLTGYTPYAIMAGKAVIATVGLVRNATSGGITAGATALNPKDTATEDALDFLAAQPLVTHGVYEARYLDFRWQQVPYGGLWLKSAPGGVDLFYPLFAYPEQYDKIGLKKGELYTLPQLLSAVRGANHIAEQAGKETAEKQVAEIAANQHRAITGEDSAAVRLKALQEALSKAQGLLAQAPDNVKTYFGPTIAKLAVAQNEAARENDYLKVHPEGESLALRKQTVDAAYALAYADGYRWTPPSNSAASSEAGRLGNFTGLPLARMTLLDGYHAFLGNLTLGQPSIGDLGGGRDRLMRQVAAAVGELEADSRAMLIGLGLTAMGRGRPAGLATTIASPVDMVATEHAGTITGTVLRADGQPAAYVIVTLRPVQSLADTGPAEATKLPALPATIASKDGTFAIADVPPGFYAVSVGSNWVTVEVKEGLEARLGSPTLMLDPRGQSRR